MKDDKKDSEITAPTESSEPIKTLLTKKRPHKNNRTGEIKYFSEYDLYFLEVMHLVFIGKPFLRNDWVVIEETDTIRLLYGPGKKEEDI